MDIIEIKGIKLKAIIGVKPWEHHMAQDIVLDLRLPTDSRPAAQNDDLSQTVDYDAITQFACQFIGETKVGLIETLANRMADAIMEQFSLESIGLTLHKPHALACAQDVSINIERSR